MTFKQDNFGMNKFVIFSSLILLSASYCFGAGNLLKRVKHQADTVSQAYGETWNSFYGIGHYKTLMKVVLDTRTDGTPNIVLDEKSGKMIVTIRLAVNDANYNAWKENAHKRFKDANMSYTFSDFENPEGRMIGGQNYSFGENEEASIRRWEDSNGGKDAHEQRRFKLTVEVKLLASDGRVVRHIYLPLSKFSRLGFESFPIPLHNLNRLSELPRSRFHWFHSDKEPAADSHVEDGYAKIVFEGLTPQNMDDLEDVKCTLLDEGDMEPLREKWSRERKEREEAERKAREELEEAERKAREERGEAAREAKEAKRAALAKSVGAADGKPVEEVMRLLKIEDWQSDFVRSGCIFIARKELSQDVWQSVMGNNPSLWRDPDFPVCCVSLDDCCVFAKKINDSVAKKGQGVIVRLPTIEEWESLSQKGTDDPVASGPHEVGSTSANAYGMFDMDGNVQEWCVLPSNPNLGILKGSSFKEKFSIDNRNQKSRWYKGNDCGFRIVVEIRPTKSH